MAKDRQQQNRSGTRQVVFLSAAFLLLLLTIGAIIRLVADLALAPTVAVQAPPSTESEAAAEPLPDGQPAGETGDAGAGGPEPPRPGGPAIGGEGTLRPAPPAPAPLPPEQEMPPPAPIVQPHDDPLPRREAPADDLDDLFADPPTPAGGEMPATQTVSRYPAMEAPDVIAAGVEFPLLVWLSRTPVATDIQIQGGPQAEIGDDGSIRVTLPTADDGTWSLQVVLTAHGFDIVAPESWSADIVLPRDGDSTPAMFRLKAREGAHPDGRARVTATLWHDGTYLASLSRTLQVGQVEGDRPSVDVVSTAGQHTIGATDRDEPDLVVRIDYDDPEALGPGQIIIASPHLANRLLVGEIDTPASAVTWMSAQIAQIVAAERATRRGIRAVGEPAPTPSTEVTRLLLEGFGREIYHRYAPDLLKEVLWNLLDDPDVDLSTIQIYSNNPGIPWELMRPVRQDGTGDLDYLGVSFLVGRWHVGDGRNLLDRPKSHLVLEQLVAIAPDYPDGSALPFQTVELTSLSRLPGYRRVPGRFDAIYALMRAPPAGIIHFAGHGEVEGDAAARGFAIRLEDQTLDVLAWRAMATSSPQRGALYFFNACDIGQAEQIGNAVEGWGPAVLDAGAGGFIGGLWPVFDEAAADFAARFYGEVAADLGHGGARVADVLRRVRHRFAETGDPTYLSYIYYGDVNLRLTAP